VVEDRLRIPFDVAQDFGFTSFAAQMHQSDKLGKLAYLQAGDIWVKELPNGQLQELTTGGASRQLR
jgi:hypothetical protein